MDSKQNNSKIKDYFKISIVFDDNMTVFAFPTQSVQGIGNFLQLFMKAQRNFSLKIFQQKARPEVKEENIDATIMKWYETNSSCLANKRYLALI